MNFAVEFDNKGWQTELRKVAGLKNFHFPGSTEIDIGGTRDHNEKEGADHEHADRCSRF